MVKLDILQKITGPGLVAVIRASSAEQAARIADACVDGGVQAMEVTYTVPNATAAIAELGKRYANRNIAIGAGTVLDPQTARAAILAGAQFIVSPASDAATALLCRRYQVAYLPGAGTAGEIIRALEDGADIVKVFPGEVLGPAFVKAVRGPLPHAPLMPTGGVSVETAEQWIRAGCVALGVGSELTKGDDMNAISAKARQLLATIRKAREA
ncbi:MAG: bifunctional 2-keto-4-hydroxyglutarate aldolase/2-keto-3-deoxy-6-phosphogluconate aldolase [Cyanobacteria bacterium]|nr:bifunctional 2-keto-4-hydroxyglutarate aldolase/2-keto-3-deoxy-6-phosphogluconate aldolase [Cyanobacteriota bacterium]